MGRVQVHVLLEALDELGAHLFDDGGEEYGGKLAEQFEEGLACLLTILELSCAQALHDDRVDQLVQLPVEAGDFQGTDGLRIAHDCERSESLRVLRSCPCFLKAGGSLAVAFLGQVARQNGQDLPRDLLLDGLGLRRTQLLVLHLLVFLGCLFVTGLILLLLIVRVALAAVTIGCGLVHLHKAIAKAMQDCLATLQLVHSVRQEALLGETIHEAAHDFRQHLLVLELR